MPLFKYLINSFKRIFKVGIKRKNPGKSRRAKKTIQVRKSKHLRSISPKVSYRKKTKQKSRTKAKKRPSSVKNSSLSPKVDLIKGVEVGEITHYFSRIHVVVVRVIKNLSVGDQVLIKGPKTNFRQKINSMQIESLDVKDGKKGQLIGLKVAKEAKVGDKLYKIV